ncbi:MAG: hypothetical protein KBE09_01290, partial [Candidatus Pacebacteria bacterium]|nr:hypothetical protein [Candidatus Paceibacterota bacterium]
MKRVTDAWAAMFSGFDNVHANAGKITLLTIVGSSAAIALGFFVFFEVNVPQASADDVTTSVTVLNTPPTWTVVAEESTESSATTPTNAGTTLTFTGTGTDSSSDNYYLLICKTSGAPTANSGAAPSCNGGIGNQWAVSAATVSGVGATAATTTIETFPFNAESNDWYAWICDGNVGLPRCNATFEQGSGSTASPFIINHPPIFYLVANDGPVDPGDTVTWTSTATDTDLVGTADTLRLYVCRSNDFNGTYCGAGGSWATSSIASFNPATTTTITIPTQDRNYNAYVYIVDNHGLVATSTYQGFNSSFDVSNVTPSLSAALISLEDTDGSGNLTLLTPYATTGPFKVRFTAVDNNSCVNASAGNEISSAIANIYRSGVGQTSCDASGEFNSNSCYVNASPMFSGHISCTQDAATCSGASDTDTTWTCNFNMWYNADPTDAATPWTAENWLASVQIGDDDFATSTLTEGTSGNEMNSFLAINAYDVATTSIHYGALEPGSTTTPMTVTTDLMAVGNIGLDEDLYGD